MAATNRDVGAVGLLRPGYTDPQGNTSDGERGLTMGAIGTPRTPIFQGKIDTLSPVEQIKGMSDQANVTMMVGSQDKVAPPGLSERYQAVATQLGKKVRLVQLEGTVLTGERNAAPDCGGTMTFQAPSPCAATAGVLWRWAAIHRRRYGHR